MLMTPVKNLVLAFMASLLVIAAPGAMAQSTEGVAALVNDQPITTVDVRNRMRLIIASTGLTQIDPATLAQIQGQAIRGLVDENLQLQAAREYDIEVTDEEINQSIQDLADRNNTTIDAIVGDLERSGVDVATLRHQLEAEIAWQVLVNGRYGSRIRISDQQIEMALERLAASASQPQFRIFEMFFEIPNVNAEEETVQRVIAVMDQLQRGAPFPELARQYSDAPSAANGGDIGWIVASQLPPEVAAIVPQLMQQYTQSRGGAALSNPVRVPGGYTIVALVAARDGTTTLQFDLVQITVPASAVQADTNAALTTALAANPTCSEAEAAARRVPGAVVTPLGAIGADSLLPQIRDALTPLREGGNTGVLQTAAGLQGLIVCERTIAGPGVPSRDDLESQLRGQQLSLHSRRWLRDLRRDGTVEIRE
ncbi:peptidylprolyl isomerase [Maricaulis sp.]|uniref:peptidylprolyl isomerase n=1 Tax=Maricaulis sp. TaxID=1486257 RepID=UPI003A8E120F